MNLIARNRHRRAGILILLLMTASGIIPSSAATNPRLPRISGYNPPGFSLILRENALFFNILASFSYTVASSDPFWGLRVSDININLISRDVRDSRGRQLVRVRVAGVVRKNNNVELTILNSSGEPVGKGFYGYDSGQLTFSSPKDKPVISGRMYADGDYFLEDLRLPPGNRDLAGGYIDPCSYCSSFGFGWFDGSDFQVGGGQIYHNFRYDTNGNIQSIRLYWRFEKGQIHEGQNAAGEAEYDLQGEVTGAINSTLFDLDRSAESYFAHPYSLLPEPLGRVRFPRLTNNTGVAITNTSGREIPVTYVARNYDGSLVSGDGIENPVTYVFAKGQQHAAYPEELLCGLDRTDRRPILAGGAVAWMEIYSMEGDIQGMFTEGSSREGDFDGGIGADQSGNPIVFADLLLNAGERTEIELLNLAYDDIMVRLQLLDAAGKVLREEPEFFIAGYGIRSFSLGGGVAFLRADDPSLATSLRVACNNDNSIRSIGCSNIAGLATKTDRFGSVAVTYAVAAGSSGAVLVGPHFVSGRSGAGEWATTVRATKFGGNLEQVYLDLYDSKGILLTSISKALAPEGQAEFLLNGSALPWGDRLSSGYVRLRSDSGSIAGDVSIGWSNGMESQITAYPLSNTLHEALQFNQVAEGMLGDRNYWTGIALLNDRDRPANVTVQVFRPDGGEDRSVVVALKSHEQYASLLSELLGDPGYRRIGGYIRVKSAESISAIVLFGESSGNALAAVPGIPR